MKLLEEIIGFVVLTGPLFVIVVWLPVSIWAAVKLSKRFRGSKTRIPVGLLVFFLVFCLPFADGIAGRLYFSYLCATEAGVKVYQTVELPSEHWDEKGNASFLHEQAGGFRLGEEYPVQYSSGTYSTLFHIDNAGYNRVDGQSGKVLGEVIDFRYWGGWIRRNLSSNNTATRCGGSIERSNSLIRQVFIPKE